MKRASFSEKRRFRRMGLSFPMTLKYASGDVQEGVTTNVCFNGAYVTDIDTNNIRPTDSINISLRVPKDDARDFPFSRLIGKARVVRVEKDALALEFSDDISRLCVAN
ncbi:hypothetical protein ACFL0P_04080 [Candidatus Omnitrophota bacterium]